MFRISIWLLCIAVLSMTGLITNLTAAGLDPSHPNHPAWRSMIRTGVTEEAFRKHLPHFIRLSATPPGRSPSPRIDNSQEPCFRGIFSQINGSCSQASAIGYIFTYEIDRARDVAADSNSTRYPTHFTYNFLNNGQDYASDPFDGWQIATACGIPNQDVYGGLAAGGFKRWMTGYDQYFHAMHNRLCKTALIDVSAADQLDTMRQWFDNRLSGSETGGIALFGANTIDLTADQLPAGTPFEGEYVIREWGPQGQFLVDHLMTFVGYDDTICLDYNGDGRYTNTEDTNGDGVVDLTDWEIGAMIIANSWGAGWANDGFIYMPYRLLAVPVSEKGMGLYNQIYTCEPLPEYAPLLTLKITLTHTCRNKIAVVPGIASDPDATQPEYRLNLPIFAFQGGPNYMQGGTDPEDRTLEFGLDVSPLLAHVAPNAPFALFLDVIESDPENADEGSIDACSVMDYTSETANETPASGLPMALENNRTTRVCIPLTVAFSTPAITTESLPGARVDQPYSQALSALGGTPPYTWEIAAEYTQQTESADYVPVTSDPLTPQPNPDDGFVPIDLGFDFPFFSETYQHIAVTTDGSIIFEDAFVAIRGINNLRNHAAITPFGSDLQQYATQEGEGIFVEKLTDRMTVRWVTSRYNLTNTDFDFSATLTASGDIFFAYGPMSETGFSFISGISDGSGNMILSSIMGESSIESNTRLVWTPDRYLFDPAIGMDMSEDGLFHGTPTQSDRVFSVPVRVTDVHGLSSGRTIGFMSSNGVPFVSLDMPDRHLSLGDTFLLDCACANPLAASFVFDEFVILDVYQNYWFWPSWSQSVDFRPATLDPDSFSKTGILTFVWPETDGGAEGLRFWGGMVNPGAQTLIDYDVVEWSYGSAEPF